MKYRIKKKYGHEIRIVSTQNTVMIIKQTDFYQIMTSVIFILQKLKLKFLAMKIYFEENSFFINPTLGKFSVFYFF